MNRFVLYIVLLFSPLLSWGQSRVDYLVDERATDTIRLPELTYHSTVRPFIRLKDTVLGFGNQKSKKPFQFAVTPLADIHFGPRYKTEQKYGLGIQTEILWKKFFWRATAVTGINNNTNVLISTNSYFLSNPNSKYGAYLDLRTRLSYTPNEVFNFQIGIDHNYFGEGARSLWQGDYGVPNPFGQIKVNFWRIQYDILYQFMRENIDGSWRSKYATTHHLSVNATRWLNVSLFESVIFRPKTDGLNRGYELEYLNPVIFLRPQEYAIGSSDNVLMGLAITAKIKRTTIYSQVAIDELNFAEIRKDHTYWGNKLGYQIGVKGHFITKNKWKHFYRVEANLIRPFTYTHIDSMHAYGHQGRPIAHPNGANLIELLTEYNLQINRWNMGLFARLLYQGPEGKLNQTNGGDIYFPYIYRNGDYGHTMAQGANENPMYQLRVNLEYLIVPCIRLTAYFENHFFHSEYTKFRWSPIIGIRSRLWSDYRNYKMY